MPGSTLPCYLYCLEFPNGKRYIGLTTRIKGRQASYRAYAKAGSLLPIHKAIRKYGFPHFRILCIGSTGYIAELEVKLIEILKTRLRQYGYNVFIGGNLGPAMSVESAAKISAANKGRFKGIKRGPVSLKTRAKMSAARRNRPPASAATRQKMSEARTGRSLPPFSAEHRSKISVAKKGRKCPWVGVANKLRAAVT